MHVPFIDLSRTVKMIRTEVLADWTRCLDQCEFVGGPTVAKLERSLEAKLGAKNFITCHSGTDAIVIGLQAMGVKPGMRVAVTNMTFWAPYEAIVQIGAEPVLIDIDPTDLQMCFEEFQEAHRRFRLEGAVFVHLFGWTSHKLRAIRQYCRENGIRLLEDGAQSFGVKSEGESVYAEADVATTSFYPAKVLGASGDAGGIACRDAKMSELLRALCNHGRAGHYTYDYVGWNSRLGGLQASYIYRMLEKIDDLLASRLKAHQFYKDYFADYPELVTVHDAPPGVDGNGYLNVMTVHPGRLADDVVGAMTVKGVSCGRTYPQTLDMQGPAINALRASDLEKSRDFSRQVINLPLFAGIREDECQYAAESLVSVLKGGK